MGTYIPDKSVTLRPMETRATNYRYAHIGDIIVAVIKEIVPNMPLERLEVISVIIVRTCKELKRNNNMII
ncbi:50S ribosomal protein L14 [Nymphaea thermarum]|nr:50S ribosomal protein L14 [Nymphaea thermarum]